MTIHNKLDKNINKDNDNDKNNDISYMGFDIVTQEYFKDMTEKGIIDSYNTIKCSIEDAISVTSLIINTECIVYKEIEYERNFNKFSKYLNN